MSPLPRRTAERVEAGLRSCSGRSQQPEQLRSEVSQRSSERQLARGGVVPTRCSQSRSRQPTPKHLTAPWTLSLRAPAVDRVSLPAPRSLWSAARARDTVGRTAATCRPSVARQKPAAHPAVASETYRALGYPAGALQTPRPGERTFLPNGTEGHDPGQAPIPVTQRADPREGSATKGERPEGPSGYADLRRRKRALGARSLGWPDMPRPTVKGAATQPNQAPRRRQAPLRGRDKHHKLTGAAISRRLARGSAPSP